MATRSRFLACLVLAAMTAPTHAAVHRTTNFIVEAASKKDAEEFGKMAEHYRKTKALEWLGKEMEPWPKPCPLKVIVTQDGAGGATTFDFNRNAIYQEMEIKGKRERLLNSVLPHEVTHTVFAHYFRQPVPRWADEGGSVYSEDDLERARHDRLVVNFLNAGRAIQLHALFRMKEYPRDVMVLYAEGYSVSKYLIEKSDRQTFLNFVATGMHDGWDKACNQHYAFKNVHDLETQWIDHLHKVAKGEAVATASGRNRPAPPPADGRVVMFDSAPPARPAFDPAPASRGLAPSGATERSSDVGWSRPRMRDSDPEPRPRATGTAMSRPSTPAAILLPPEPAPSR
jgi:hypothetical protein